MQTELLQIHSTPGRLRVRSPQLKGNPSGAVQARARLEQLSGVESVQLNRLTGSLLIHFDPGKNSAETLVDTVLSTPSVAATVSATPAAPTSLATTSGAATRVRSAAATRSRTRILRSPTSRKVARAACAYAGEKLVEHLVIALITAVL